MRTIIGRLALLAMVLLGVSGCSQAPGPRPSSPSRSSADVLAALKAIPGVEDAQITGGPVGLPGQVEYGAGLALATDYHNDVAALLDYILRQLWSQSATKPTTTVTVSIQLGTGSSARILELGDAGSALGLTNVGTRTFAVSPAQMKQHFGAWPGTVPTLPATLDSGSPATSATPAP